MKSLDDLRH